MELDTGTPEKQVPAVLEMEHREDIEMRTRMVACCLSHMHAATTGSTPDRVTPAWFHRIAPCHAMLLAPRYFPSPS